MTVFTPEHRNWIDINNEISDCFHGTRLMLEGDDFSPPRERVEENIDSWEAFLQAPYIQKVPQTYIQSTLRYHIIGVYAKRDKDTADKISNAIKELFAHISSMKKLIPDDPAFWQPPDPDTRFIDPYQQTIIEGAVYNPSTGEVKFILNDDLRN